MQKVRHCLSFDNINTKFQIRLVVVLQILLLFAKTRVNPATAIIFLVKFDQKGFF